MGGVQRAEILGVVKSAIWYILKNKECIGDLNNTKRPGKPQRKTEVDDGRILSVVIKKAFHWGTHLDLQQSGNH